MLGKRFSVGGGCWRWYVEKASSLLQHHVSIGRGAFGRRDVEQWTYPAKVSASKVERWSYWSMGTMGMDMCPSGPVTVCIGMGVAHDMVMVSKPSIVRLLIAWGWGSGLRGEGACAQRLGLKQRTGGW